MYKSQIPITGMDDNRVINLDFGFVFGMYFF